MGPIAAGAGGARGTAPSPQGPHPAERQEARRHQAGHAPPADIEAEDAADGGEPGPREAVENGHEDVEDRGDEEPDPADRHDQDDVRVAVGIDPLPDLVNSAEARG